MPKLLSLHDRVLLNYEVFLELSSNTESLVNNFNLFKDINNKSIRNTLKRADASTLGKCNKVLITIAFSHIEFVFSNQNPISQEILLEHLSHLNKAQNYLRLVSNAISNVPPYNMNANLGNQKIEVEFYLKKVEFQKAQIEFASIQESIKSDHADLNLIKSKLKKVITAYSKFHNILLGQYKDRGLRIQLSLTEMYVGSIFSGMIEAEQLLEKIEKNKKPVNNEQSLGEDINMMSINTEAVPTSKTAVRANYSPIFWAPPPVDSYIKDSNETSRLLNQWGELYTDKFKVDQNLVKSFILEKFAHTLILAAIKLHNESGDFQSQKSNPCIQLAIQLFLRVAEMGSTSSPEAFDRLSKLSSQYSEMLELFVSKDSSSVLPEQCIQHLHKQGQYNAHISILGLNTEETVEKVFQYLNSQCKMDDYKKVIMTCNSSIESASNKLKPEETMSNSLSY